ncbi:hypothetical protein JI735_11780 [Paenibacillus sonchi]|uniref:Uncharacterized protein n=1 Tax=Paenibacillus sonchi TaxID=373687 RepID=A0A974PFV3_9BACL|nr:hypothetical protein [Paenibacillus sonchi]QQZ63105.1 hypothetical protein JI735_11780 [Paenibacillus sonchi]
MASFQIRIAGGFAAGLLIGYNRNMAGILIIRQENGTFDSSFQGAMGYMPHFSEKKEANGLREGV